MKLSLYTIVVNDFPQPGQALLYHTRTQAMVTIDEELKLLIHNIGLPEYFRLRVRYAKELDQLYDMGILVENKWHDLKKLALFLSSVKHDKIGDAFPVTILTTTQCNLKCKYCFEESARNNKDMDAETCDSAIDWIQSRMEGLGYKELRLNFYGGEPLLNEEAMEYIALRMGGWCASQGLRFKFMLQTNGYLLTRERVEKYLPLGLTDVRVSVDGVGEDHDRNRPLRDGGKTFDTIMRNIADNAALVKIGLSVSYDKTGVQHLERLVDYLEGLQLLRKLGRFVCAPVHGSLGPAGSVFSVSHLGFCENFADEELLEANRIINDIFEKKGLPYAKGLPLTACSLVREKGGVSIDPEGYLYACNSMIGRPELSIGHVKQGFGPRRAEFLGLDVGLKCRLDCPYLPVCNGGCRLMSFLQNGRFDVPYCRKAYLDRMAPELIKKEYYSSLAGKQ